MGCASTVPVADERVDKSVMLLNLKPSDIAGFWKVFQKFDKEREGTLKLDVFFSQICRESRTLFGDAIFELIDSEDTDCSEFKRQGLPASGVTSL